ncbi:carboxylesterase/lipase family protein [Asticcacaulis sp. AND118]|uniref:carboxylesterase/lipase family protein n=1 Tax=Asticcacaulis sp. AND118 TaxID=2840468 RepID=UPI001CFF7728|nr:carboxylesterase/lipase family protein [Asticcacaulis sp. AND118]UDF03784.1 carboxylesterase/lipase family protein [Asticcacaulis sp. AND118]
MKRRDALAGLSALGLSTFMTPVSSATPKTKAVTVTTTNGPVTGQVKNGTAVFLGLRYGDTTAPPYRFLPPRKPQPWTKPMRADTYGPASPQQSTPDPYGKSEDCLFLNVWTPEAAARNPKSGSRFSDSIARPKEAKTKRPVMVYFHGGAYANGSGSHAEYEGTNLSQRGDVVVVTVNHRLNAFGYLYLARLERLITGQPGPLAFSGNCGQLDLILALEWVRDNIAAFGGDPDSVMVFGQSGGGAKIATLMATPKADGLFHKAATMSGQQVTASGPGNATTRARAFLGALGLKPDAEGLKAVQTLPWEQLVTALKVTDPVLGSGGVYMGPVLDETILFRHPFYPDAAPQSRHIPMIIGNTLNETKGFQGNDPAYSHLTWADLAEKMPPSYRVDIDPWVVIDTYRKLYPQMTPTDVYFAATTAGRSWRGAIIEAEERAKISAKTYVYQANWQSPKDGGKYGAPHAVEIPLVFRNTAVPSAMTTDSEGARRMADLFSDAFIAFARTGSPQTAALPEWTPYSLPKRETMLMDVKPQLANDPRGEERKLFDKVPFVQAGT